MAFHKFTLCVVNFSKLHKLPAGLNKVRVILSGKHALCDFLYKNVNYTSGFIVGSKQKNFRGTFFLRSETAQSKESAEP